MPAPHKPNTKAANEARRLKGQRNTKPLRFTLPTEMADALEAMTAAERNAVLERGFKVTKKAPSEPEGV